MSTIDVRCPECEERFPVSTRSELVGERAVAVRVYRSDYEAALLEHQYQVPAAHAKGSR